MKRTLRIMVLFIVAAVVASACGTAGTSGGTKPAITIGSTNFSEQLVLGELYSQILEANGYAVTRKFNLGNREIVFPALQSGQIDMEADYLATLLAFVDKTAAGRPTRRRPLDAAKGAHSEGRHRPRLRPGRRPERLRRHEGDADKYKLAKLSDLASIGGQLVLGGPPECPTAILRGGLKNKYGITFKEFKPLDVGGPLTVTALAGGQIDVGCSSPATRRSLCVVSYCSKMTSSCSCRTTSLPWSAATICEGRRRLQEDHQLDRAEAHDRGADRDEQACRGGQEGPEGRRQGVAEEQGLIK